MGRLGGGVDDDIRFYLFDQCEHTSPVTDVDFVMLKTRELAHQPVLVPARVALRPKKHRTLVVVHAVDFVAKFTREIHADFGADQTG